MLRRKDNYNNMPHYNPMLERLQQQIQEYNKDTEAKIDQVANRQNLITLTFVVFNIIVFLALESTLRGKEPILLPVPHVIWESNPISFNENRINWSLFGEISWKNNENCANTFSGIESYTVNEHDAKGRPSYLQGKLVGTVLIGNCFYVVSAVSKFKRR